MEVLSGIVAHFSKISNVAKGSASWSMNLSTAAVAWAVIAGLAAFYGIRLGYSGRSFALALGVAAALFAFELFLAAPRVLDRARHLFGEHGAVLAPLVPLFAVLIYTIGVTANWRTALLGAAYTVLPALLAATCIGKPAGQWQDYAAVLLVWLPIELRWKGLTFLYVLFPYPPQLMHTLTILLALSTGVAAFVLLRRLDGIGYAVEWRRGFAWNVILHFGVFAVIALALGLRVGFLTYAPSLVRLRTAPIEVVGILFFTAWPEEFLFRGVLQNILSRTFKNQWAGLAVASVAFGFAHIFHAPYPNWKYVLLATVAGLFYGRTWIKTGSLFPGAIVHALVDILWHILFR
jgi:membrane protease YdiL (CAAX protease family)